MVGIVERLVPDEWWELFQRVAPQAPSRPQDGGRRRHGDREVLAALVFVAASGACGSTCLPRRSDRPEQLDIPPIRPRRGPRRRGAGKLHSGKGYYYRRLAQCDDFQGPERGPHRPARTGQAPPAYAPVMSQQAPGPLDVIGSGARSPEGGTVRVPLQHRGRRIASVTASRGAASRNWASVAYRWTLRRSVRASNSSVKSRERGMCDLLRGRADVFRWTVLPCGQGGRVSGRADVCGGPVRHRVRRSPWRCRGRPGR